MEDWLNQPWHGIYPGAVLVGLIAGGLVLLWGLATGILWPDPNGDGL